MRVKVISSTAKQLKTLPRHVKRDLQKKIDAIRAGELYPEKFKSRKNGYKIRVGENDTHRAFFEKVKYKGETILELMWVRLRKDAYKHE